MSVQQKTKQKNPTTLLHFHVTKMAIINSAVKGLTTNMEPPPTQKKKQTNKQKYPLSSPIIFIHKYVSGCGLSLES